MVHRTECHDVLKSIAAHAQAIAAEDPALNLAPHTRGIRARFERDVGSCMLFQVCVLTVVLSGDCDSCSAEALNCWTDSEGLRGRAAFLRNCCLGRTAFSAARILNALSVIRSRLPRANPSTVAAPTVGLFFCSATVTGNSKAP